MSHAAWLLLLVGCAGKAVEAPVPPLDDVEVRVDSVWLGGRCTGASKCSESSARLSLRSAASPAKVRLVSVTVGKGSGRSQDLAAHTPTVWTSSGRYEAWNETIAGDEVMAIEYGLTRVDWDQFVDDNDHVRATDAVLEIDGRVRVFGIPARDIGIDID